MSENSEGAFQYLVGVLEEAVQEGADSVGLEREDGELMVVQYSKRSGLAQGPVPKELEQALVDEIIDRAGLAHTSRGEIQIFLAGRDYKVVISDVLAQPDDFTDDEHFGQFAKDVIADREFVRPDPIDYRTWGSEIDEASHAQMRQACGVPMAAGAALMPDPHVGYLQRHCPCPASSQIRRSGLPFMAVTGQ